MLTVVGLTSNFELPGCMDAKCGRFVDAFVNLEFVTWTTFIILELTRPWAEKKNDERYK